MNTLAEYFESAKLPVISEVAQALVRTLNNPDASPAQVQKILAQEPTLTANVLRMANSAQFGLSRQVQSLDHAIQLLGMARVRALALSESLHSAFPSVKGLNRIAFWKYSMACAAYAQWLAKLAEVDVQQAWLAGVMLRLGELIIADRSPQTLAQMEEAPSHSRLRWERAHALLGFDEGQVTAVLARHWNFPPAMVEGLQNASNPMQDLPFSTLGGVLHLAALLADSPTPPAQTVQEFPPDVVLALALDPRTLADRLPTAEELGLV
ncbi:MAG: HDOD domain-containing protein [Burkholderiales bacterium]|nr:HDOD domain-containing protein [Burkholderiales bacterium]MBK9347014.1 HDOD domain-containing protein [Burkholderiales bacterium]